MNAITLAVAIVSLLGTFVVGICAVFYCGLYRNGAGGSPRASGTDWLIVLIACVVAIAFCAFLGFAGSVIGSVCGALLSLLVFRRISRGRRG